jgi:hypothetical protein
VDADEARRAAALLAAVTFAQVMVDPSEEEVVSLASRFEDWIEMGEMPVRLQGVAPVRTAPIPEGEASEEQRQSWQDRQAARRAERLAEKRALAEAEDGEA